MQSDQLAESKSAKNNLIKNTRRQDVDGLRAIAVISVILYHAFPTLFPSGFIGVDIFFVISGYVISKSITYQLQSSSFSFIYFWKRRFFRLMPVAFLVLIVNFLIALILLSPNQLIELSQSILAFLGFGANIFFWQSTGYFETESALKPLLHLWSLSVEQQFYLLFPLALLLLYKRKLNPIALTILFFLSFFLMVWASIYTPSANFYLIPTRIWEFLIGYFCVIHQDKISPTTSSRLEILGLSLIVISIFLLNPDSKWPNPLAILPTLGSALILLNSSSKKSFTKKILSSKILVFIGLASYSLYLWHQPILAYGAHLEKIQGIHIPHIYLIIICIPVSFISWRLIEIPFQQPRLTTGQKASLITSVVLIISCAFASILNHGIPARLSGAAYPNYQGYYEDLAERSLIDLGCHLNREMPILPIDTCGVNLTNGQPDVLLLGDSHLEAIGAIFLDEFKRRGVKAYATSYSGCMPIRGLEPTGAKPGYSCSNYTDNVYRFAREVGVKTIILVSRFPLYLQSSRFKNGFGCVENGGPYNMEIVSTGQRRPEQLVEYAGEFLKKIRKEFDLILFYPAPPMGCHVPDLFAQRSIAEGVGMPVSKLPLSISSQQYFDRIKEFRSMYRNAELGPENIFRADLSFYSPDAKKYLSYDGAEIFYADDDHLSHAGATKVIADFFNWFEFERSDKSN